MIVRRTLRNLAPAVVSVVLLIGLPAAQAQPYSRPWSAVAGGGGLGANPPYMLTGTIGQPTACAHSNSHFVVFLPQLKEPSPNRQTDRSPDW